MEPTNQSFRQVAALPLIFDARERLELCLVTTRGGGRWIIPKGNPIKNLAPHEAAAREAREEAGLVGKADRRSIGAFDFERERDGRSQTCRIEVYPLYVERRLKSFAEARQRSIIFCPPETAMRLVAIPGLSALIEDFVSKRAWGDPARFSRASMRHSEIGR